MDDKGYISVVVVLILLVTSIFSSNIINNIDNEIKLVNLELEKHKAKSNRYNNYLEMISQRNFIEEQILKYFKDEGPFSRSIKFNRDHKNYLLDFYKDKDSVVKIKIREKDKRNSDIIYNYGEIIKEVFKEDIIRYTQLNKMDKEYIEKFMLDLSSYESRYVGHYGLIEEIKELEDNMRIKYIDCDLYIDEDIELDGIIIVKGVLDLKENVNFKINGKLICGDINNIKLVEVDNQKNDILLSYSKYIPGFLEYRPEVIKLY